MRSSSLKTVVATLSIAATLLLSAPISASNRNEPRQGRAGDLVARMVKLIKRVGGITTFGLPTVPTGEPAPTGTRTGPSTTGSDTGTSTQ